MKSLFRFRNARRGSAIVMFTLMTPTVIIPLAGLGIDATMLYIVQAKLSAAVDGAALGAGRLLGTAADPKEIAGEFLKANFRTDGTNGFWGAYNLVPNISYTNGLTKIVTVNATADVPLLFARVFRQPSATVAASAVSMRRDSRVEVVIDRSGSMNTDDGTGTKVITDVVNYAQSFVAKFSEGTDELGLVVYDGSAVVGYPTVRPWDTTTTATSTGGPNSAFTDGSSSDMMHQIQAIKAGGGTGMAEALWMAYIELQKAHMKDLQKDGVDNRLNSIVLMTDGMPTAISLYLNNPTDNMIRTGSSCVNKTSTTVKMQGWFVLPGSAPWYAGDHGGMGMYLLAGLDANTASYWMSHGGSDQASPSPSAPFNGCTGLSGNTPNYPNPPRISDPTYTDFSTIPTKDMWGNDLTGGGYVNSSIAGGDTSSVYRGTALNRTQKVDDYHWALAIWNSVDNAAARIRADANLANRPGDLQNMQVAIYTIGYTGNGGVDEGLLRRVANDASSTSYDGTQAPGRYIPASDKAGLAAAFDMVASMILRLAQ